MRTQGKSAISWGTIYYDLSKIRIEIRKGYLDVQVEVYQFKQVELVRCTVMFSVIQPEEHLV